MYDKFADAADLEHNSHVNETVVYLNVILMII